MARRIKYSPEPVTRVVEKLTQDALGRDLGPMAHLFITWPSLVGPAFEETTKPLKFTGRTLHVAVIDASIKVYLQHQLPVLIEKINQFLGQDGMVEAIVLKVARVGFPKSTPKTTYHPAPTSLDQALERLQKTLQK